MGSVEATPIDRVVAHDISSTTGPLLWCGAGVWSTTAGAALPDRSPPFSIRPCTEPDRILQAVGLLTRTLVDADRRMRSRLWPRGTYCGWNATHAVAWQWHMARYSTMLYRVRHGGTDRTFASVDPGIRSAPLLGCFAITCLFSTCVLPILYSIYQRSSRTSVLFACSEITRAAALTCSLFCVH